MTRNYPVNSDKTIETITRLREDGIRKIGALIRHSDRFYSKDPLMEPFMGLNDAGKGYAYEMGRQLPAKYPPQLHSSLMARCVETAYLIDKGFTLQHGTSLPHNTMDSTLYAFYITDFVKALGHVAKTGTHSFLRSWFNREIDTDTMKDPLETTDRLVKFMTDKVGKLEEDQLAICVSHDWNIYPVKEFKLGLPHETFGDVGYLDGVVFFEKENKFYITSYQIEEPVAL